MAISGPETIRCVVFDVYDTVAYLSPVIQDDLLRCGRTPQAFAASIGPIALRADVGQVDFDGYQKHYKQFLGVDPNDPEFDLIPRLRPIEPMHELIAELANSSVATGLLSNVSRGALRRTIEVGAVPWGMHRAVVQSCRLGFAKPDPRLFVATHQLLQERTSPDRQLLPDQVLFVDDSPRNTQAAARFGWQAVVFDPSDVDASTAAIREYHLPFLAAA